MSTDASSEAPDVDRIAAWLRGRLPESWVAEPPEVTVDREEITVLLALGETTASTGDAHAPAAAETTEPAETAKASSATADEERAGRISRFREETRGVRMRIADEAESRYGRKVAWGVRVGDTTEHFTRLAVPVMTRLRQPERVVLDTLVEAGVARSRSHALAWCVRLVGERSADWLADLREAMAHVERVRSAGPTG